MFKAQPSSKAFTIVELLIVIVVIAVLAAISVVAYSGLQNRAKSTEIVTNLKNIEKAFRLLGIEQGRSTWWLDTEFTGVNNPNMNQVISSSNLSSYLQTLKPISGIPSSYFVYDNDGENLTPTPCTAGQTYQAVSVFIRYMNQGLWELVDNSIDDGDPNCGKVRWSSSNNEIIYKLSYSQDFKG